MGGERRLAVAQCCFAESWGGLEMSAVRFVQVLANRGHDSTGLCRAGSPLAAALAGAKLPLVAVGARDYIAPGAVLALRRWIRRRRPAILHAHRGTDLWLLRQATLGLRPRPRLVWTSRIFFVAHRKLDPVHRWLYRDVRRAVALSEVARAAMLDCLPLAPERVVVIPNGVDLDRFPGEPERGRRRRATRAALGLADDIPLIGIVGRLDGKKGQSDAIIALARLAARHPTAELALVGGETVGESGERARLERLASELGVARRVRFLGERHDVPELLAAFDLFALPSHSENFGNVVLEAMAAALPVIGTDAGGTPEMLAGGEAGVLVPPRDPAALAAAIGSVLADAGRRRRLAAAARRRAETCYALPAVVARTEALYREVLAEPPR